MKTFGLLFLLLDITQIGCAQEAPCIASADNIIVADLAGDLLRGAGKAVQDNLSKGNSQ